MDLVSLLTTLVEFAKALGVVLDSGSAVVDFGSSVLGR